MCSSDLGGPGAAQGGFAPAANAGQPSALKAMLEGVQSAAAWAGAEQGGQGVQPAGGSLPAGSAWFVPGGGQAQPAAPPSRSTGSRFTSPPQPFPVGSQSPLPLR